MKERIKKILSILNVEYSERFNVLFLMIQAILLGAFNGSFNIIAHSLFIKTYPISTIPVAFIISGLIGFFLTTLFYFVKSRVEITNFLNFGFGFLTFITIFITLLIRFSSSIWPTYLAFVFLVPVNILCLHIFRTILNREYSNQQSLRLFGLFNYSWEAGVVIVSFILPFLAAFAISVETIFFVSTLSISTAFILEIFVLSKLNFVNKPRQDWTYSPILSNNFRKLISNKYALFVLGFVLISAIIAYGIHFIFLGLAVDNFESSVGLTKFFGIFTGTITVFIFVADRYLLNRLLNNLGMPYSIILSPVIIGVFILIAAILGGLAGSSTILAEYTFFFMIISFGKLMARTFEDAVERPSVKILDQAISDKLRPIMDELLGGNIGSLTIFVSGVILYALTLINGVNLVLIAYLLIPIFILWFFATVKLLNKYRDQLKAKYDYIRGNLDIKMKFEKKVQPLTVFKDSTGEKIIYKLRFYKNFRPVLYRDLILQYLSSIHIDVRKYVFKEIEDLNLVYALSYLKNHVHSETDEELKLKIQSLIKKYEEESNKERTQEEIANLIFSVNNEDKKIACRYIVQSKNEKLKSFINILLKDIEPDIKECAIIASSKIKHKNSVPILMDFLLSPTYFPYAFDALIKVGDNSLENIEQLFYDNNMDMRTLVRSIRIIGKIRGKVANDNLIQKFESLSKEVIYQAVLSLKESNFEAKKSTTNIIIKIIVKTIETCAWNMAAQISSRHIKYNEMLQNAIKTEIQHNYQLIFLLLSLIYNDEVIKYIEHLIYTSRSEGIEYALELMDLFVDEDLKNVLFPLLQDIYPEDKVRLLQFYFTIEKEEPNSFVNSLINRDYNQIRLWTKVCAIWTFLELNDYEPTNDLKACLFSPEQLIRETAGVVLHKIDPEAYNETAKRLDKNIQQDLDRTIELYNSGKNNLLYDKILFLKQMKNFKHIDEDTLLILAKTVDEKTIANNSSFEISLNKKRLPILIVYEGEINIYANDQCIYTFKKYDLFDLLYLKSYNLNKIEIRSETEGYFYLLTRELLDYNMFDHEDLVAALFDIMNKIKTPSFEITEEKEI